MFLMHRLELFNNFRLIEDLFDRFSKETLKIAQMSYEISDDDLDDQFDELR